MKLSNRLPLAAILVLAVCSALVLGCGDDDDGGDESAAADVESYCVLSKELDSAGSEAFSKLEQDPKATQADFEAAERDFVQDNQENLDAIAEAAPEEISKDVETLIASLNARAGLGPEVDQAEASTAEKNIQAFEKQNC